MIPKEKKCKAVLPDSESAVNYRQRLLQLIIAKFVGQQTVISIGNEIHYAATPDQEIKIQSLIDVCTDELDELVGHMVYSFLRRKNLLPPSAVEVIVKKIA